MPFDLTPALPEIFLALAAMALLMLGVYRKEGNFVLVSRLSVLTLLLTAIVMFTQSGQPASTFNGMFVMDGFAVFMKSLVLIGSAAAILMSRAYLVECGIARYEFPVVILLATLGMMMMISAGDFLALYMGLELQSLSLYILAAFDRERTRATEAGLKYFVLGALSSGMLLYGISLVYGFTGTIGFAYLADMSAMPMGAVVGLVFILAGLAFKVSAVPFHMWTPDVYEGAPTPVTAFFAAAPKIAAMALLARVLYGAFPSMADAWQQVIVFIAMASMALGAFAALVQTNIKRLLAYSSIGHVGYALVGVATGTQQGLEGVMIYLAIYMTMTIGAFAVVLSMRRDGAMTEEISDLAGLSRNHPRLALAMAIFMFSLAGIPLLAGFFGKLFIFLAAVEAGMIILAVFGLVASVVAAYYYLRIVKIMYFDEPAPAFDEGDGSSIRLITLATALVNSPVSFLLIYPLMVLAAGAAAALF